MCPIFEGDRPHLKIPVLWAEKLAQIDNGTTAAYSLDTLCITT